MHNCSTFIGGPSPASWASCRRNLHRETREYKMGALRPSTTTLQGLLNKRKLEFNVDIGQVSPRYFSQEVNSVKHCYIHTSPMWLERSVRFQLRRAPCSHFFMRFEHFLKASTYSGSCSQGKRCRVGLSGLGYLKPLSPSDSDTSGTTVVTFTDISGSGRCSGE